MNIFYEFFYYCFDCILECLIRIFAQFSPGKPVGGVGRGEKWYKMTTSTYESFSRIVNK